MITIVFLLLILLSLWVGFYQLFKQQGRILLRLDELQSRTSTAHTEHEHSSPETEAPGLPLESAFPAFSLPDLAGNFMSLDGFRGRRVLLVNWNFECGFCDSIAPQMASLESSFEQRNVQLLLLAHGESVANREGAAEHGLKCPILLVGGREDGGAFGTEGTPVAYLVDEEGRVAAPVARGADRVLALALELAGPQAGPLSSEKAPTEHRGDAEGPHPAEAPHPHRLRLPRFLVKYEIGLGDLVKRMTSAVGIKTCVGCERRAQTLNRWLVFSGLSGSGLKAGTSAPDFQLPDLQGRMVSLQEYRGRRVILFFSDPQCGPCDELAPQLVRMHREGANGGLSIVVVGRGDVEENRRKAQQYGMDFPILLQDRKWRVSKAYDILATPAAFLIREDGVIASDPAVGSDAILTLVRNGRVQS
jgi:peroxiredoxin